MIILSMLIGFLGGAVVDHQVHYCACYRDNFVGEHCEVIKGSGEQGSCQSKK